MNIDWSIIRKNLENTATAEEVEQYNLWLAADKKHIEYIKQVSDYYAQGGKADQISDAFVQQKLQQFGQTCKERSHLPLLKIVASVAASLLILVGVGSLIKFVAEGNQKQTTIVASGDDDLSFSSEGNEVKLITGSNQIINIEESGASSQLGKKADLSVKNNTINYNTTQIVSETIEQHKLIIPCGKSWNITLADGTNVYLNANSELHFPSKFLPNEKRVVRLIGEGYFEVAPNKKSQFVVKTDMGDIMVYGTKFNVNTNLSNTLETVLAEGSVALKPNNSLKEIMLVPNEKVVYNRDKNTLTVEKVCAEDYIAWIDGIFLFNELPLDQIMQKISAWYNVNVIFKNETVKQQRIYCRLPRTAGIDTILEAIGRDDRIQYKRSGREIVIW